MTPRKKVIDAVAHIFLMMELTAHFKKIGKIDDFEHFFDDWLNNNREIKRIWDEINREKCSIQKHIADKMERENEAVK